MSQVLSLALLSHACRNIRAFPVIFCRIEVLWFSICNCFLNRVCLTTLSSEAVIGFLKSLVRSYMGGHFLVLCKILVLLLLLILPEENCVPAQTEGLCGSFFLSEEFETGHLFLCVWETSLQSCSPNCCLLVTSHNLFPDMELSQNTD